MQRRTTALVGTLAPIDTDDLLSVLGRVRPGQDCDLVELRLDLLTDAEACLDDLFDAAPLPVVATCRRVPGRSEEARLGLLGRAAALGAAWIDVEHDVPPGAVSCAGAKVLRSAHLDSLPADPEAFVESMLRAGDVDGAKLVVLRSDDRERVRLIELVRQFEGRLAAHAIDAPATRYASTISGGLLTYAALGRRAGFGFDLPDVREFAARSGRGRTGAGTRAFLLLGRSVEGSVSPWMLNRAFADANADVLSLAWSCEDVEAVLEGVRRLGWAGAAVTAPFKERALDWVREQGGAVGADAIRVGSANTVLFNADGSVSAENTDLGGLLDTLRAEPAVTCTGRNGLVLGAGGAARAAVCAVQDLGGAPWVWSRRAEQARELAAAMHAEGASVRAAASKGEALATAPALVIDATPAGPPAGTPLLDPSRLPEGAVVMDMLVAHHPTALLAAASPGRDTREGVVMLAHQAARQVECLTASRPPVDDLLAAGRERLARRARRIVFVGLRGSGKTALGAATAALLGRPFVDLDERVAQRMGETPDALIASGREREFRQAEEVVLLQAAEQDGLVVATGGGAALHLEALEALAADSLVVLLDATDTVLLARLDATPRAALTGLAPELELARERTERMGRYRAVAGLILDTGAASLADLAARVADLVAGLRI